MGLFRNAVIIFILFLVYTSWFDISKTLASGDWPYLFKETIQSFSFSPDPFFLWLGPYYQITSKVFVQYLHIPWELTEKIWWFWMFLVISFFSSWYLARVVLKKSNFHFLSIVIFMSNTYIFMIVGGGQLGVPLAYAFAPAVLGSFIKLTQVSQFQINFRFIKFAFLFAMQFMFDPRIAYIMILAFFLYFSFFLFLKREYKTKIFLVLAYAFSSGIIVFILNSSWIILRFLSQSANFFIDSSSGSLDSLNFFSFGLFSNTFSLLHPNWPENIFGKVGFMKPEFILIPILAYSGLLFLKNNMQKNAELYIEKRRIIFFFATLGLMGAFLAKGTKEPFPQFFAFLFTYFPGFSLFRDPTKFYILIILAYSILIPFSLEKIVNKIPLPKHQASNIVFILFILLWGFLIRQSLLGELGGTFRSRSVPLEYISLKNFLIEDSQYSPILWMPIHTSFSFYSKAHPFIDGSSIFGNLESSKILMSFNDETKKRSLKKRQIKYIVVPYDIEGRIFLDDRKYSEKEYKKTVDSFKKIPFLTLVKQFGKIMVFEIRL